LGGSDRKARDYYTKAIELSPDEPLNFIFYARLLRDGFGDRPAALEMAERGLRITMPSSDRVESVDAMTDLKTFIANTRKPEKSG
jgi:tetratricopeptide (TPR) repeat protein